MTRLLIASLPAAVILGVAALFLASPVLADCGLASWYGSAHHGRLTASGERFDMRAMTAAHKSLPFGTRLRVSLDGRSVTVRITDRGPYVAGRVLDLSRGAAARLGMIDRGVARVCWERVR